MTIQDSCTAAMTRLLSELLDGPDRDVAFVLNPGDAGLLESLARIATTEASAPGPYGGASIAAHADHLRYGFELLNRWSHGEDPFASSDYAASWRRQSVTADEWARRRQELAREAQAWRSVVQSPSSALDQTVLMSSIVHLAYHLGAMRQIASAMRGPRARD